MGAPSAWPTGHTVLVLGYLILAVATTFIALLHIQNGGLQTPLAYVENLGLPVFFSVFAIVEAWRDHQLRKKSC